MQDEIDDLQHNSDHEQKYMDDPEKIKLFYLAKETQVRAAYDCYTQPLPPAESVDESKLSPDAQKHYHSDLNNLQKDWQHACFYATKETARQASEVYQDYQYKHKQLVGSYNKAALSTIVNLAAVGSPAVVLAATPTIPSPAWSKTLTGKQQEELQRDFDSLHRQRVDELKYSSQPKKVEQDYATKEARIVAAYQCYSSASASPISFTDAPWVAQLSLEQQQYYHDDLTSLQKNWHHECYTAALNGPSQSKETYNEYQYKYTGLIEKYQKAAQNSKTADVIAGAEVRSNSNTNETISSEALSNLDQTAAPIGVATVLAMAIIVGAAIRMCVKFSLADTWINQRQPLLF